MGMVSLLHGGRDWRSRHAFGCQTAVDSAGRCLQRGHHPGPRVSGDSMVRDVALVLGAAAAFAAGAIFLTVISLVVYLASLLRQAETD